MIANNVIELNLAHGIQMYPHASGQTIVHNTIVGSGLSGIVLDTDGGSIAVANNISAWNSEYGIRTGSEDCEGCWADLNLLFGNPRGEYYLPESLTVERTIRANPLFVDRSASNYDLRARSAAIDCARPDMSPRTDFEGRNLTVNEARPLV